MDVLLYIIFGTIILVPLLFFVVWRLKAGHSKKLGKKALRIIDQESPYRQKKIEARKTDEFRSKQKNKKNEQEQELSGVSIYDPHGLHQENAQEVEIVGLAETKGFWSNFIRSQKFGYIMSRLNAQNNGKKGFWVHFIKAQATSQSREASRGR